MKRSDSIRTLIVLRSSVTLFMMLCATMLLARIALSAQADDGSTPSASNEVGTEPYTGPPTWYAQSRVSTQYGVVSTHFWSKGPMFRALTMLAGHPVTTIVDATHYYVYDETLGRGVAIERNTQSIAEDAKRGRPFGYEREDLLASGGELVRDGVANEGEAGFDVYQLTNDNGRRRVIVTASDPPLPIRIETFVRSSGAKGVLEYAGWQRDFRIENSFFVPSSTVDLERLTYAEYVARASHEAVGPAPVYYRDLLHGKRPQDP